MAGGTGRAGGGAATGVRAEGWAGGDPGRGAGRDRAGRLGPADPGLDGRLGCVPSADSRVVDRAVAGGGDFAVICGDVMSRRDPDMSGSTITAWLVTGFALVSMRR